MDHFFLFLRIIEACLLLPYEEVNRNSGGKSEQSFGAVEAKSRKIHLTTSEFLENSEERSQMDFS